MLRHGYDSEPLAAQDQRGRRRDESTADRLRSRLDGTQGRSQEQQAQQPQQQQPLPQLQHQDHQHRHQHQDHQHRHQNQHQQQQSQRRHQQNPSRRLRQSLGRDNESQVSLSSNTPTAGGGSHVSLSRVAKTGWNRRPKVTFPSSHSTTNLHQTTSVAAIQARGHGHGQVQPASSPRPRTSRVALRPAMKPAGRLSTPQLPSDSSQGPSLELTVESRDQAPTPRPRGQSFRHPPDDRPNMHVAMPGGWDEALEHAAPLIDEPPPRSRRMSVHHREPSPDRRQEPRPRSYGLRSDDHVHSGRVYHHQQPRDGHGRHGRHESVSEFSDSNLSDHTHATTAESSLTVDDYPKPSSAGHKTMRRPPVEPLATVAGYPPEHHRQASVSTAESPDVHYEHRHRRAPSQPTPSKRATSQSEGRRTLHIEVLAAPPPPKEPEEDVRKREDELRQLEEKQRRIESNLQAQIAQLQQQLQAETDGRESDKRQALAVKTDSMDQLALLQAEHERYSRDIKTLERERSRERNVADELRRKIEEQAKELSDAKELMAEQSKTLCDKVGALERAEQERDAMLGEKTTFELKANQLEQELEDLRAARTQTEIASVAQLAASEITRETLQLKVDNLLGDLSDKDKLIETLTKERDSLSAEVDKAVAQIVDLGEAKKALEEDKQKAEEKVVSLEDEVAKLRSSVETFEGLKAELETKVSALEGEAEIMKTKVEELEKDAGEKAAQLSELSAERDGLKDEIAALTTAKEEMQRELDETKQELEAAKEDGNKQLAVAKEESDKQLAVAKEESDKQLAELSEKLAAAEADTAKVQAERVELQSKTPEDHLAAVAALEAAQAALATKTADFESEKAELATKLAALETESASKTADADAKLAALTAEKTELEAQKTASEQELASKTAALAAELEAQKMAAEQELASKTAALTAELEAAKLSATAAEAAREAAAGDVIKMQMHFNQMRVRLAAAEEAAKGGRRKVIGGVGGGGVLSSGSASGSGALKVTKTKEELVFVRNSQDRGRMQVMKKSDLRSSRSSSRTRA